MPVLIDTGVILAYLHSKDARHQDAQSLINEIMSGRHGEPISSDLVLGEGLTFIRKRIRERAIAERFSGFFHGWTGVLRGPLRTIPTTPDVTEQAVETYFRYFDRGLSFTDCVLLLLARRLDAQVATFDGGFDRLVPVLGRGMVRPFGCVE